MSFSNKPTDRFVEVFGPQLSLGRERFWSPDLTWQAFIDLAIVTDSFSEKVVGWSIADDKRTELVGDAFVKSRYDDGNRGG